MLYINTNRSHGLMSFHLGCLIVKPKYFSIDFGIHLPWNHILQLLKRQDVNLVFANYEKQQKMFYLD